MPVFWQQGFANTSLQDLEKATGVNKSGLYSEFKDKEDIFIESIRYYYSRHDLRAILLHEPLGWDNIDAFLKQIVKRSTHEQKGCFAVNSMRELESLPTVVTRIIAGECADLKHAIFNNVAAEKTNMPAEAVTDVISTFFSGFCIEQNLRMSKAASSAEVESFMLVLRSL